MVPSSPERQPCPVPLSDLGRPPFGGHSLVRLAVAPVLRAVVLTPTVVHGPGQKATRPCSCTVRGARPSCTCRYAGDGASRPSALAGFLVLWGPQDSEPLFSRSWETRNFTVLCFGPNRVSGFKESAGPGIDCPQARPRQPALWTRCPCLTMRLVEGLWRWPGLGAWRLLCRCGP